MVGEGAVEVWEVADGGCRRRVRGGSRTARLDEAELKLKNRRRAVSHAP